MPRTLIERHIPWPRDRHWRPGEPLTLTDDGQSVTYLLRGVMRDTDPRSEFATVTLELQRAVPADAEPEDGFLSAAG